MGRTWLYYRAIQQFMTWVERAGYQHLEDIEPITVAAYIETLQRQAAAPTVKRTRLTNPPYQFAAQFGEVG